MRLTLRTLLAYLDDILEPTEARDIGAKINESSYASSLVNKIKDVVRRRRISAPEVTGPGSTPDPNVIAEYLDNTLAPEAIADLERVCLESDTHLAEVAASHQILTLVLGEPVEIPTGMRERMYALGAVPPPTEENGATTNGQHVTRVSGIGAADIQRNTHPGSGEVSLEDRLPEALLPRKRSWPRLLPYVIGAMVIGMWGWLMFHDKTLTGQFTGEMPRNPAATQSEQHGQPLDADAVMVENANVADASETIANTAANASAAQAKIPIAAVTAPDLTSGPAAMTSPSRPIPENANIPPITVKQPIVGEAPSGDAITAATPKVMPQPEAFPQPKGDKEMPAVAEAPVLAEPFALQDISTTGVLLHQKPGEEDWTVIARRSLIFPNEEIAAPTPFDVTLNVGDNGRLAEVLLRGGTRLRSLGSSADTRVGFDVRQGRLIVRHKGNEGAAALSLRLQLRDDIYRLELLEPGTIVGVEVIPVLPTGEDDHRGATEYEGQLIVTTGAVRVSTPDGRISADLTPANGVLELAASKVIDGQPAPSPEPHPLLSLPNWLDLGGVATSATMRRFAKSYEKEFIPDQPISQSIRPVVKDRLPKIAELATKTLALTGSYPGLIDALSSPHEESRIAAIIGLKRWMSLSPENGNLLLVELQDRYRPAEADALHRLLWGYGEQDARNKFTSEELIDWMGHNDIAIRELAFFHVHRLTDRRYDYRPNDPTPQRTAAIDRWRRYVRQKGALIGD